MWPTVYAVLWSPIGLMPGTRLGTGLFSIGYRVLTSDSHTDANGVGAHSGLTRDAHSAAVLKHERFSRAASAEQIRGDVCA